MFDMFGESAYGGIRQDVISEGHLPIECWLMVYERLWPEDVANVRLESRAHRDRVDGNTDWIRKKVRENRTRDTPNLEGALLEMQGVLGGREWWSRVDWKNTLDGVTGQKCRRAADKLKEWVEADMAVKGESSRQKDVIRRQRAVIVSFYLSYRSDPCICPFEFIYHLLFIYLGPVRQHLETTVSSRQAMVLVQSTDRRNQTCSDALDD
jgi:hypothetical protein